MKAAAARKERQAQGASRGQPPKLNPTPKSSQAGSPIRVLIVDDHVVVRRGLRLILAQQKSLAVIGEAADGQEALVKARQLSPQVVLMDIDLPKLDGLTISHILHRERPEIKVVLLSMYDAKRYGLQIVQSGARGFISKEASPGEIAETIRTVAAGGSNFGLHLAQVALNEFVQAKAPDQTISGRERDVLVGVAEGLSNKEIACHLGIGVRTVESHRERVMRKLKIHTVAGLTKFAIGRGLIWLEEANRHRAPTNRCL